MRFFRATAPRAPAPPQPERILQLEQELAALKPELEDLRELVRHLDEDRRLLLAAVEQMKPGLPAKTLAEDLFRLVFHPFDLASFYVALLDDDGDRLRFVFFHEGGRTRKQPSRRISECPGLTGNAIRSGAPLYLRTLEEAQAMGTVFTEAELSSGLIPQSWFGVPLGDRTKPIGLVSFQSFQQNAFPEERRAFLEALSRLLANALGARPNG